MRAADRRHTCRGKVRLRRPRRLGPGAVIGVLAPASPTEREPLERGVSTLRGMGFEVRLAEEPAAVHGYLAGTDAQRAAQLNRYFADEGIDAVMCARGGYGSMRILPLLEYKRISARPKMLIGFSDATALLWAVYSRSRVVGLHGPVVTTLAEASAPTLAALLEALVSAHPRQLSFPGAVAVRSGTAKGAVCGGNLTTLCHLLGTAFAPSFRNRILFLEDRGEAPYRIDRMLTQMGMAGCFRGVRGVVLGAFADCGRPEEIWEIAAERLGGLKVPVLAGIDAGHVEPNITIPIGVGAELDADRRTIGFERATVG
jgi:muramoyltetrapeptide carboxypeptidase